MMVRQFKFGCHGHSPWNTGRVGDVITQTGPRVGERHWLVVHIDHKVRWSYVTCQLITHQEAITEARNGAHWWTFGS